MSRKKGRYSIVDSQCKYLPFLGDTLYFLLTFGLRLRWFGYHEYSIPTITTPPPQPLTKVAPSEPEPQGGFDFLEFMKNNSPYNFGLPQKQSKTVNVPYPVVASAPPVQKTAPSSMMPSAGRLNNTLYDVQLNSPALT